MLGARSSRPSSWRSLSCSALRCLLDVTGTVGVELPTVVGKLVRFLALVALLLNGSSTRLLPCYSKGSNVPASAG